MPRSRCTPLRARFGSKGCAAFLVLLASCGSNPDQTAEARQASVLVGIHYGRLCDVYAEFPGDPDGAPVLLSRDVLAGPNVPPPSERRQAASAFSWRGRDPISLRPRLVIQRPAGSDSAEELLDRISRDLPSALIPDDATTPVIRGIPRDCALEIRFDGPAPVTLDDLVSRDEDGDITGLANRSAVQLLHARGGVDEEFHPLGARILPGPGTLVVDPVVSPTDAETWQIPESVHGLPPGRSRGTRDLRLALRLEGPGSLPGRLDPASPVGRIGQDPDGQPALLLDLRIATPDETDGLLRGGVLADDAPPRLLASQAALLAASEPSPSSAARAVVAVLSADGTDLRIEEGDSLLVRGANQTLLGDCQVLAVLSDEGDLVRAEVEALQGLVALDPRRLPGIPSDRDALRRWLTNRTSGQVELLSTFDPAEDPPGAVLRTRPDHTTDPDPQALRRLSPFDGFALRFDEPIDPTSLRPLDNFFVGTRDLFDDRALVDDLVVTLGGDPSLANLPKLRAPHLVGSRASAVDATTWRIEPILGLYLDDTMRDAFAADPDDARRFDYFVHLVGGAAGIRDPAGNPVIWIGNDLELTFRVAVDLRRDASGFPVQPDNRVAHVVRRFDAVDEDARPSPFLAAETPRADAPRDAAAQPDMFGAGWTQDGRYNARPTARRTEYVDPWNQAPLPSTVGNVGPCPPVFSAEGTDGFRTSPENFGVPLMNPLNPSGARIQTAYREIDLGLSLTDPNEFDLDVEAAYWAFSGADGMAGAEVLDRMTLQLGHSEFRPEPCFGQFSGLPIMPNSGLSPDFAGNYANNPTSGPRGPEDPLAHTAFAPQSLTIDAASTRAAPLGDVRYHPLPRFEAPFFTFRDQRLAVQGGDVQAGADVRNSNRREPDYLESPYGGGLGRRTTAEGSPVAPTWSAYASFDLATRTRRDTATGGSLGAVALPLLLDWQIWPNAGPSNARWSPGDGGSECISGQYRGPGDAALGFLGIRVSLALNCTPTPNFRAFSGGFPGDDQNPPVRVGPGDPGWERARGGYTLNGRRTQSNDNTVPWSRLDFLAQRSVITSGLVDLYDPHRREGSPLEADPRLGPFLPTTADRWPQGTRIQPDFQLYGANERGGASIDVEFRATGPVDPEPWRFGALSQHLPPSLRPTQANTALDPQIAADCWLRKYDARPQGSSATPRDHWTYPYHRNVTETTERVDRLFVEDFLSRNRALTDEFGASDVRSVHWRFVIQNGWMDGVPTTPSFDGTAFVYRIE